MIQQRNKNEQLFDYIARRTNKDYEKDLDRNKFKRQLTSTTQIDEHDSQDVDDEKDFTYVPKSAKRKPKSTKSYTNKENKGNGKQQTYQTNISEKTGGRIFINTNNRMYKNKKDDNVVIHHDMNQHYNEFRQ
jgi:hypothetical protein